MSNITYGIGEPTSPIAGSTVYVDLETDTMYQYDGTQWVVFSRHGIPVGDEYLYIY